MSLALFPLALLFLIARRFRAAQGFHRVAIVGSSGFAVLVGLFTIALATVAAIDGTRAIVALVACVALGFALTGVGVMGLRSLTRPAAVC